MKTVRSIIRLLIQMLVLAGIGLFAFEYARHFHFGEPYPLPQPDTLSLPSAPAMHRDSGPTIEQVRKLSMLTVTKVDVADVQETTIQGYLGGTQALMLIKGDVLISVDLAQARFESKDEQHRTAVLVLPQPQVTSPRLDQEKTRLFAISKQGLWLIVPADPSQTAVVNQAYLHAQQVVAQAGSDPRLIEQSRQNTEEAIKGFFGATGWTVKVRWGSG